MTDPTHEVRPMITWFALGVLVALPTDDDRTTVRGLCALIVIISIVYELGAAADRRRNRGT